MLDKNGKSLIKFNEPFVTPAIPSCGIGYIEPGHFVLAVVDERSAGGSKGMDMKIWAKLFEGLKCKCAYNLDGGGSVIMVFMGKAISHPSDKKSTLPERNLYFGEKETDMDMITHFPSGN